MEAFIIRDLISYIVPAIVMIAIGTPLAVALGKRIAGSNVPARDVRSIHDRLERIETAIDAIAIEVERISEAQRYSARLHGVDAPAASIGPSTADRG